MSQTGGDTLRLALKPEGLGPLGEALAESDGLPVHVFGGIPGESVLAEVVRRHPYHLAAHVVEVLSPSPQRVAVPCAYFGQCTGCQWQHLGYDHQLEAKERMVQGALERVGGIAAAPLSAIVPAPQPLGYRNHARFTVKSEGLPGFVHRETRRFVPVDRCLLMHPWINETLSLIQGHCSQMTQVSLRYGVNTGQWVIVPALESSAPVASGQMHYEESLLGRRLRIHRSSFFQVNTVQAEQMARLVCQRLALTGRELVVDAYAGVGTFAVLLAPLAAKVVAVEASGIAIRDAEVNIQGLSNVELVRATTEEFLGSLAQSPDVLVLDPPRVGCHPVALYAVLRRPPRRMVYISCDPWTLARDLKVLLSGPFRLEEVIPIDVFPQTHHIESIALLSPDSAKRWTFQSQQQVILASESPRRQEIMTQMGLTFRVMPSEVEEPPPSSTDPVVIARERALRKARAVASTLKEGTVVGADTVVAYGNEVLGKPASGEEARAFLSRLRGKEHRVITGLAVVDAATGREVVGHRRSRVHLRRYSDAEIEAYVASGDPLDKAGGYAIQDALFHPVGWMKGCYLNVVGLPPCILVGLLHQMHVYPILDPQWAPPGHCPDCHRLARQARRR